MNPAKPRQLQLTDPIDCLPGVGEYLVNKLTKLGVITIGDLVELVPRRVEDRSMLVPIKQLPIKEPVVIHGKVESVHGRLSNRGVFIVQVRLRDASGAINALWFNQRYLLSQLKEGEEMMLFGEKRLAKSLGNPFFVKRIINTLEVVPIYPSTAGLYQATIRALVKASREAIKQMPDLIPGEIRQELGLSSRAAAIEACHFATDEGTLNDARQLLAFEELLVLALQVLLARQERLGRPAESIKIEPRQLKRIVATLPFQLTNGQRRAAWQIIQDLAQPYPMNRLLYGEVGSGKTAVALLAAAAICLSGRRVAWLNPTAILAAQAAQTLTDTLGPLGLSVALVTGGQSAKGIEADIIVGTHVLLGPKVSISNLGLIIVDEQHRFGVEQRAKLVSDHPNSHRLMMTATPIPRSLAQTVFGHLELTYLDDKPAHQLPVKTVIFKPIDRAKIEKAIEAEINLGRPGFVICPTIEEPLESQPSLFGPLRRAVNVEADRLKQRFPQAKIGIVHGQIEHQQRQAIIEQFKAGQVDILLSTTVVEVGIDNPRATWILIEEADRFGLATLHQLRGRVGRGQYKSVCYLAQSVETDLARRRLEVLRRTNNGLKIAEADLELRGPGEIVGREQSGLPSLKYASLSDQPMIDQAFTAATAILDKGLTQFPQLAEEVLNHNYGQAED